MFATCFKPNINFVSLNTKDEKRRKKKKTKLLLLTSDKE